MTAAETPHGPATAAQLTIVTANEASWADLQAIFGTSDYPGRCYCQAYKVRDRDWKSLSPGQRQARLREQTHCGDPRADYTTGLVAYLGADPAGWVAVEPRTVYARLPYVRTVWNGRHEDKADAGVWAVTCFVNDHAARPGDHLGRAARRQPSGLR